VLGREKRGFGFGARANCPPAENKSQVKTCLPEISDLSFIFADWSEGQE
jgi:hypothetical protein